MKHYEVWVRDEDVHLLDWCEKKEIPKGTIRLTRAQVEAAVTRNVACRKTTCEGIIAMVDLLDEMFDPENNKHPTVTSVEFYEVFGRRDGKGDGDDHKTHQD